MDWDKLKFWEKKEESNLDFPDLPSYPTGVATTPGTPPPQQGPQQHGTAPPSPSPYYQAPQQDIKPIERVDQPQGKDHEIMNLKLDAIKNALESVNMRLERLENLLTKRPEREQKQVWYK